MLKIKNAVDLVEPYIRNKVDDLLSKTEEETRKAVALLFEEIKEDTVGKLMEEFKNEADRQ